MLRPSALQYGFDGADAARRRLVAAHAAADIEIVSGGQVPGRGAGIERR